MSLKYGLNIKRAAPPPLRRTILDDGDDDEEDAPGAGPDTASAVEEITTMGPGAPRSRPIGPPSKPLHASPLPTAAAPPPRRKPQLEDDDRQDLSSLQASAARVHAAESLDASIFDYDSFHDAKAAVTDAAQAEARADAQARKPRYIDSLLDAAARRKQDQTLAREKLLQRERAAEGDEFADKEKFVTGAYRAQQEENRRVEEEERRRVEGEEKRKRALGGGMQGFYRGIMDQQEKRHQATVEAAARVELEGGKPMAAAGEKEKTDAERAAELRAQGVNVHLNDEGQVTDKRELLAAGLNVAPTGKLRDDRDAPSARGAARAAHPAFAARQDGGKLAQRERQSRMIEEQLAAQAKRAREEEEEERARLEKAAKSAKSGQDVNDARARYLARKAAREKGEG